MISKKVDEKYLIYDFLRDHKDYKEGNWFSKFMQFNFAEIYTDELGYEEYVFRDTLFQLREEIIETNYDYNKFRKCMEKFADEEQAKHIAWLCELDIGANTIKSNFEKDTGIKVKKVHWKTLKKYHENEKIYQKQIYEFRCESKENELYFQKFKKQVDDIYKQVEKEKQRLKKENKKKKDRER